MMMVMKCRHSTLDYISHNMTTYLLKGPPSPYIVPWALLGPPWALPGPSLGPPWALPGPPLGSP